MPLIKILQYVKNYIGTMWQYGIVLLIDFPVNLLA